MISSLCDGSNLLSLTNYSKQRQPEEHPPRQCPSAVQVQAINFESHAIEAPSALDIQNAISNYPDFKRLAVPIRHFFARIAKVHSLSPSQELSLVGRDLDYYLVMKGNLQLIVQDRLFTSSRFDQSKVSKGLQSFQ